MAEETVEQAKMILAKAMDEAMQGEIAAMRAYLNAQRIPAEQMEKIKQLITNGQMLDAQKLILDQLKAAHED